MDMSKADNPPRLCIVSSYEFKDTNATKARLGAYLDLLGQFFDITLLCPDGGDATAMERVEVVSLGRTPARGGFSIRAIRELLYAVRAWMRVRLLRPDVVLASCPSMFLLLLGLWKRSPTVLDIRDLTWEYLSESGLVSKSIKSLLRYFAKQLIIRTDLVLVTNEQEYRYVEETIKSSGRDISVRIVRNGISARRFEHMSTIPDKRDPEHPVLLYVGNIGIAQNLITLVDAVKQYPDLEVVIVGEGRDLARVKRYAKQSPSSNIVFVGGVPWERLVKYYSRANILYAQITADFDSAIPSKLYEYLATGIPVIYGGQGVAAEFVQKFDDVEIVEPENPAALSQAIARTLSRIKKPKNDINVGIIRKNFLREKQVEKVAEIIAELAGYKV
jgi:glycosyltransferase involved in cell wall biosynthesis